MKAKIRAFFVTSILILLFCVQNSIAQVIQTDSVLQKAKALYQSVERLEINPKSGVPQSVRGILARGVTVSDLMQSKQFLHNSKSLFRINVSADDFTMKKTSKDELNMTHAKLQQTYKSIPVWGSELVLHSDFSNTVVEVNGRFTPDLNIDIRAGITSENALNIALTDLGPAEYRWQNPDQEKMIKEVFKDDAKTWRPIPALVIAPLGGDFENGEYRLAWKMKIPVDGAKMGNYEYFVDAKTGEIINKFNSMPNAVGTGTSNYNGTVTVYSQWATNTYQMQDTIRNIKTYTANNTSTYPGTLLTDSDNNWNQNNSAVDVHWGIGKTYDFFNNVFSRISFDNDSAEIRNTVNYYFPNSSTPKDNAAWNGVQILYGDGQDYFSSVTSLDVAAHEFTHAVTDFSADLIYQGESGALNESISDIFGATIEFYATPSKANWLIGEECYTPGTSGDALRYMNNPNLGGQPDTYLGTNWYIGSNDNGGVHTNSGVLNYAFYLMTIGGSGTNDLNTSFSVTGIGIEKTRAIAYRALTVYLTSSSNYAVARTAFLSSASDLYGSTSPEYKTVSDAFGAVGIGIKLIAKNSFDAGTIKVNSATVSSGYTYFATSGSSQSYEAIPQYYNPYDRVWNTSGVDPSISYWRKQPDGGVSQRITGATNISYSFTPSSSDHKATFIADLMKRYSISRNDQTEYDGTISAGVVANIVEQNSGQISAPLTKSVNGKDYRFYQWSDGGTSNSRNVTPNNNTTYTALYKAHLYSTSSTSTTSNSQRKIVQSSTGVWAMVYESSNQIWACRSTDGTTWETEKLISDNTTVYVNGYPSIAVSNNIAFIVWQGINWVGGTGYDLGEIFIRSFDLTNNTLGSISQVASFIPDIQAFNANPVFDGSWQPSSNYDVKMVAWREPSGIKVRYYNNGWSSVSSVTGTNSNSYNPSIADYNGSTYILALEDQYNHLVKYTQATYGGSWSFSTVTDIPPTDWESNAKPQITLVYGSKPTVVWTSRNNLVEGGASVHVRQKSSISGTWGNITSFSQTTTETLSPVIDDYLNSTKMDVLWNIGNTVYKGSYNGSSWSGPTVVTTSGGSGINVNKTASSQTRALWKLSSGSIAFNSIGIPKIASTDNTKLLYRINRHGIMDVSKLAHSSSGSIAFEIAWVGIPDENEDMKIDFEQEGNKNLLSSKPFTVTATGKKLFFAGAVYGSKLNLSSDAVSKITEPLAKVSVKENKTGRILEDIWIASPSMLLSVKDGSFGEYKEITVDLNKYVGKEIYLDVETAGKLNKISPLFVDDYLIVSDSANVNLGKGVGLITRLPESYALMQNYPNPFNPSTIISYSLPNNTHIILKVFDVLGNEVATLINEEKPAGNYEVEFNASGLSSGIYFYRIQTEGFIDTKKLILLK